MFGSMRVSTSQSLPNMDETDDDRKLVEAEWVCQGLADLFDKANAPIFAVDLNGLVTEWNLKIAELTGKPKEAMFGKRLSNLVTEKSQQNLKEALASSAKGEVLPPFPVTMEGHASKEEVKLMGGFSPQFGNKGQVIGSLCVAQVLPDARHSRPESKVPSDTSSSKTKGMVMHELRSPLHGIIGLANTLANDDESTARKPLKMIGTSAERVLELVTNLMDYWNFSEDACAEITRDAIDLATLTKDTIKRCEAAKDKRSKSMRKESVNIVERIQPNLPPLLGDTAGISQVFHHIILNAMKFTNQGRIIISVDYNKPTDCFDIVFEDTGIGIDASNFKRIFEPFQQEDSSESRKYEGIGLGLAIVREVVRIHHGTVKVESTQGKGSKFIVTLPASGTQGDVPEKPSAEPSSVPSSRQPSKTVRPRSGLRPKPNSWLGPAALAGPQDTPIKQARIPPSLQTGTILEGKPKVPTVLIPPRQAGGGQKVIMSVDDDHVNQEVMRSVLEPCGFSMVICMSGAECLECMNKENTMMPDLVLLDLMMPGINGFDVLTELRKRFPLEQLPLLMVSAKNQASSVVKGLELGCNDWIHKPFDRQELIARVQTHLKLKDNMVSALHSMSSTASTETLGTTRPTDRPKPTVSISPITEPVDTTVLYAVVLLAQRDDNVLTRLFELFESASAKHDADKTEMLGNVYMAMAQSTETEVNHADKMLQLALTMEEVLAKLNWEKLTSEMVQFRVGIHTDSNVPPVVDSRKGLCLRQYPTNCYHSTVVLGAKGLAESASGTILLSRSTRCRLSADLEREIQDQGLQMVARQGCSSGRFADHFILMKAGAPLPHSLGEPPRAADVAQPERVPHDAQPDGSMLTLVSEELAGTRVENRFLREQLDEATNLLAKERKASAEFQALHSQRAQAQAAQSAKAAQQAPPVPPQPARPHVPPGFQANFHLGAAPTDGNNTPVHPKASTLYLQWQNSHLQAKLRYMQDSLVRTKGQLQMQTLRYQAMEQRQGVLQERIEHLELDLGFKAACSGFMGYTAPGGSSFSRGFYTAPEGVSMDPGMEGFNDIMSGDGLGAGWEHVPDHQCLT